MTEEKIIKHDPYGALRIRDFSFFIGARFFLTLAIQIQSVVVGWQIYQQTKDPLSLGMIGLTEAVPFICIALFAGHVADIVSRKKIIVVATGVLVISTFCLFYFTWDASYILKKYGTLPIYSIIFFTGVARAFLGPSFFAFLSQLVPRNLYSNAATWNSTVWQIGAVSGPALGGLFYGFFGVQITYLIDVGLVIISWLLFLMIHPKTQIEKEKKESIFASVGEGIRFVFKNQVMLGALSLDLFAVFFGGAVALLPIFADKILHVGPEGLGLLRAAPAFGAVIIALFMAHRPPAKNAGRILIAAVMGFGFCMILFALSRNFYLSLFVLALSGAFDNISVVIRSTILQLLTPDNMRGRVSAVNSIFIGSSNEVGEFESGMAAKLMTLVPSVIFGGCMTIIVVLLTGRFAPKLRKLNLQEMSDQNK